MHACINTMPSCVSPLYKEDFRDECNRLLGLFRLYGAVSNGNSLLRRTCFIAPAGTHKLEGTIREWKSY